MAHFLFRFRDVESGGLRTGWLNLGGFAQYTLVQDVEDQFLLIGGLRWEAPCGSHEVFQGHGPVHLAPYLTGQAEGRPFFSTQASSTSSNVFFRTWSTVLPDAFLMGSNRPTFTFNPADDANTIRQFFTHINVDTLVFLAQTTWPLSTILRLWVEQINGVPNAAPTVGPPRDEPPDFARFLRLVELLQISQDRQLASIRAEERVTELSGPLPAEALAAAAVVEAVKNGLEYLPREDGKKWVPVRKERRLVLEVNPGAEGSPELAELAEVLNLTPGRRRYELVIQPGCVPDPARVPTEPSAVLRVVPRSTSEVWFYLANGVEVPAEHLACGPASPRWWHSADWPRPSPGANRASGSR